ncbi:MAG: hypothetical protein ABH864_06675 [archaeon]
MRVVGFNLSQISAEKSSEKVDKKPSTSIEFTDLQKDKVDMLKEGEVIKISFKYLIVYGEQEKEKDGNVAIGGTVILSVTKDEAKDITKDWKKKKLPAALNMTLFNLILKRCTPKAIFLEDEVGLPMHTPSPRLGNKE